jgi:hypothetical protein
MYQRVLISGKINQLLHSQEVSEKMKWPNIGGRGNDTNLLCILCMIHTKLTHCRQISVNISAYVFISATTKQILKSYVQGHKSTLEVTM